MKKKKCTNPKLGGKISLKITFNLAVGKGIHLTPEQSQHLAQCEECNELLPLWFKKGEAERKYQEAGKIVDMAEKGDSRVLKKSTRHGTAYFKPQDDRSKGLLVKMSSTGDIYPVEEATLDEFNRLE